MTDDPPTPQNPCPLLQPVSASQELNYTLTANSNRINLRGTADVLLLFDPGFPPGCPDVPTFCGALCPVAQATLDFDASLDFTLCEQTTVFVDGNLLVDLFDDTGGTALNSARTLQWTITDSSSNVVACGDHLVPDTTLNGFDDNPAGLACSSGTGLGSDGSITLPAGNYELQVEVDYVLSFAYRNSPAFACRYGELSGDICFELELDTCPADLDGDGRVQGSDLLILLNAWGIV